MSNGKQFNSILFEIYIESSLKLVHQMKSNLQVPSFVLLVCHDFFDINVGDIVKFY